MRKAILFILATMMMASCAEQQGFDNTSMNTTVTETNVEGFDNLMVKARRGDGNAYLKLAECYTKGEGVKADFLATMTMLTMARDYGGISDIQDYLLLLPEDNNIRMTFDAICKIDEREPEKVLEMADELIAMGCPDGYAVKSLLYLEMDDSVNVMQMASTAAEQGSSLGKMILLLEHVMRYEDKADDELLMAMGEEIPVVYLIIANKFSYYAYDNPTCKERSAKYYLKADEHGVIDPDGARWLMDYMEEGDGLYLSETDIQRLKKLSESTISSEKESR